MRQFLIALLMVQLFAVRLANAQNSPVYLIGTWGPDVLEELYLSKYTGSEALVFFGFCNPLAEAIGETGYYSGLESEELDQIARECSGLTFENVLPCIRTKVVKLEEARGGVCRNEATSIMLVLQRLGWTTELKSFDINRILGHVVVKVQNNGEWYIYDQNYPWYLYKLVQPTKTNLLTVAKAIAEPPNRLAQCVEKWFSLKRRFGPHANVAAYFTAHDFNPYEGFADECMSEINKRCDELRSAIRGTTGEARTAAVNAFDDYCATIDKLIGAADYSYYEGGASCGEYAPVEFPSVF